MTVYEASKLRVGDVVQTTNNVMFGFPICPLRGKVVGMGYFAVKIKWEDGILSTFNYERCRELTRIVSV